MELAAVRCENEKLREIAKLENEYEFLLAMYGNIIND